MSSNLLIIAVPAKGTVRNQGMTNSFTCERIPRFEELCVSA
jgi:hypothetical protein